MITDAIRMRACSRVRLRAALTLCAVLVLAVIADRAAAQTVTSLTFTPSNTSTQQLTGGQPSTATVRLSWAVAADTQVTLTSSSLAVASVPLRVTVAAGTGAATFMVASSVVRQQSTATITASLNGSSQSGTIIAVPGYAQVIGATFDTYVEGGSSANSNFGRSPVLRVAQGSVLNSTGTDCSVVAFDTRRIGTVPLTAMLRLFAIAPTGPASADFTFDLYECPDIGIYPGNSSYFTWNNLQDFFQGSPTGRLIGTYTRPLVNGVVTVDLTQYVQTRVGMGVVLLIAAHGPQAPNLLAFASDRAPYGKPVLVLTYPPPAPDSPVPGWAEDTQAIDSIGAHSGGAEGIGPAEANGVNMATGVFEHMPEPDVVVHNPAGPDITYARRYRSSMAVSGASAPGLPAGWTDNWDLSIRGSAGSWQVMPLRYPNRGADPLTPVLSSNNPTGKLTTALGAPYAATGVPAATAGRWTSITLQFKDMSQLVFTPTPTNPDLYLISSAVNITGQSVTVNRNSDNTIASFSGPGGPLVALTYSGGFLSAISDVSVPGQARTVGYTYGSVRNVVGQELLTVSQMSAGGSPNLRWSYGYTAAYGVALLNQTSAPNPAGPLYRTASVDYDGALHVARQVDAEGNVRNYFYVPGVTDTSIRAPNLAPGGNRYVNEEWSYKFNATRDTGPRYQGGSDSSVAYDPLNPFDVSALTNGYGQRSTISYDVASSNGNVSSVTVPCAGSTLTTTNTWDYSLSPTGLLAQTHTGPRTPTTFTYYDGTTSVGGVLQAKGLVQTVSEPAPGSSGTGATVTSTYAYTALGDIAAAQVPAPRPTGTVTYTFSYTGTMADGSVRSTEVRGEPVTITDPLGHATTYAWDGFGNETAVRDADGNTWRYTYVPPFDACHQVTRADYPPTDAGAGSAAAYETYTYLFPGGPLTSVSLYANTGDTVPFRTITKAATNEDVPVLAQGAATAYQTFTYPPDRTGGNAVQGGIYALNLEYWLGNGDITYYFRPGYEAKVQNDGDYNAVQRGPIYQQLDTTPTGDERVQDYGAGGQQEKLTYDALGRVVDASDLANVTGSYFHVADISYAFDDGDRLLSQTVVYNSLGTILPPQTVSYTYNADGSRDTMTTPAGVYGYTYDDAGRLTQLDLPWHDTITYTWSDGGRLLSQRTGLTDTAYAWTPRGLLAGLSNVSTGADAAGNSNLSAFTGLAHDAAGELLGFNENVAPVSITGGGGSAGSTGPVAYAYDAIGRLVMEDASGRSATATGTAALNVQYRFPYAYDSADDLVSLRVGAAAVTVSPDGTQHAVAGVRFGVPFTIKYDSLGDAQYLSKSDAWGRPNGAFYRADSLRALGGDTANLLLYDGEFPVASLDPSGNLVQAFAYGAAGLAERWPGAGSNYFAYTFDPSGNVVERSSLAGVQGAAKNTADWVTRYDAFGAQLGCVDPLIGNEASAANQDMVGFGGQWGAWTDHSYTTIPVNTASVYPVVHMAYRDYDPALGRYIQINPLGCEDGLNPYTFAGNDPVDNSDPLGIAGGANFGDTLWSQLRDTHFWMPSVRDSALLRAVYAFPRYLWSHPDTGAPATMHALSPTMQADWSTPQIPEGEQANGRYRRTGISPSALMLRYGHAAAPLLGSPLDTASFVQRESWVYTRLPVGVRDTGRPMAALGGMEWDSSAPTGMYERFAARSRRLRPPQVNRGPHWHIAFVGGGP